MEETKPRPIPTPEVIENKTLSSAGQSLLSFEKSKIDEYKSFNLVHSNRQGTPQLEKPVDRQKIVPATPYRYSDKDNDVREKQVERT